MESRAAESPTPYCLADVTEHMVDRFLNVLDPSTVARVVRHCNRELILSGYPAPPGAVQQLATKRLTDLAEHGRRLPKVRRSNRRAVGE